MTPAPVDLGTEIQTALIKIRSALVRTIEDCLTVRPTRPTLVRVERPIPRQSLLSFLAGIKAEHKVYWRERSGEIEIAGIGAADIVTGSGVADAGRMFEFMQQRLESGDSSARYFGGCRFDRYPEPKEITDEWQSFGGGCFVLPLLEISQRSDTTVLAAQVILEPSDGNGAPGCLEQLSAVIDPTSITSGREVTGIHRQNFPDRDDWSTKVERALQSISSGDIEKLVLARRVSCSTEQAFNMWTLVERTFAQEESATVFALQVSSRGGFLGGTPELLYRRDGREVYSEAVAGTRRVTRDQQEDQLLASELLRSQKERREVDLVREAIAENLGPWCAQLRVDSLPQIHRAGNVQHLRYTLSGQLNDIATDAVLLGALSPTPAVCGTPGERAIGLIRELEPFDRGWYAGPIGWVSRHGAEFAVAIRSALVDGNEIHMYSGVGLVEGSEAQSEWQELEAKISCLATALKI